MRRKRSQQCVRGTLSCTATEVGCHGCLVCRFVHEQQVKLESGVGEEEAASSTFWAVRNSGVDIRLKKVCTIHHCCLLLYIAGSVSCLSLPFISTHLTEIQQNSYLSKKRSFTKLIKRTTPCHPKIIICCVIEFNPNGADRMMVGIC